MKPQVIVVLDDLRTTPGLMKARAKTLRPGDTMWFKHWVAVVRTVSDDGGGIVVGLTHPNGTSDRRYRRSSFVLVGRERGPLPAPATAAEAPQ